MCDKKFVSTKGVGPAPGSGGSAWEQFVVPLHLNLVVPIPLLLCTLTMLAFLEGLAAVTRVDGARLSQDRVTYIRALLSDAHIGRVTAGNIEQCGDISVTAMTAAAFVRSCFRWGSRG